MIVKHFRVVTRLRHDLITACTYGRQARSCILQSRFTDWHSPDFTNRGQRVCDLTLHREYLVKYNLGQILLRERVKRSLDLKQPLRPYCSANNLPVLHLRNDIDQATLYIVSKYYSSLGEAVMPPHIVKSSPLLSRLSFVPGKRKATQDRNNGSYRLNPTCPIGFAQVVLPTKKNQAQARDHNYCCQRNRANQRRNYPFHKEILA